MGVLARGDVVLFRFPFSNLTSKKLRPCVVLSSEMGEDVLLGQITSKKRDKYTVDLKKTDTTQGALRHDSYIRANMLFTADKRQVRRKICELKKKKYAEVVKTVVRIIS